MGRAVAIARLDLAAEGLRSAASVEKDGAAARRFWRWRSFSKVWTMRARPGFAGWIGRPCGTGCIATMMKVLPGCATGWAEGVRRSFPRNSGRSSPRWSRLAPIRRCTRSFAGAGLICAMRSSDALASKCMNVRSARCWRPWVTAVCRCARNIPRAILRPRRLLKKLCGDPDQRNSRGRKRKTPRNLVSGRSAFRAAGHADPCVGQTRHASARAARPTL